MPMNVVFILFCVALFLISFRYYRKTKHPFLNFFAGALSGILCLVVASFLLPHIGVSLGLNYSTLALSSLLGVPGVALMAIFLFL